MWSIVEKARIGEQVQRWGAKCGNEITFNIVIPNIPQIVYALLNFREVGPGAFWPKINA